MENGGYDAVEMKPTSKQAEAEGASHHYDNVIDDAEQGESSRTREKTTKPCTKPFAGMGKEELLQFSQTKGWRAARWVCLLIIFAGWCTMLAMAIVLIVTTPRCLPWWQSTAIYQIFPRSFKDSNGDGIGDLAGITSEANYIESLGVRAIMLSSIYKSGGMDNGEDIVDFRGVDEVLGNMDDFDALVEEFHNKDIKVILDFIPNHSSEDHPFFNESRRVGGRGGDNKYQQYYTWKDEDFTNWISLYSGKAWTAEDEKGQYYLHQFSQYQPDFNLANQDVISELSGAMETWFTRGVDGFNIRGAKYFFESSHVQNANEPPNPDYQDIGSERAQYDETLHYYTSEYQGLSHDLLRQWRDDVFYKFSTAGTYRIMMTDSDSNTSYVKRYYGEPGEGPESDIPMNFNLLQIGDQNGHGGEVTGLEIQALVNDWMDPLANQHWPNFQLGNYATRRITSRLSPRYSKAANLLLLTLPGTPICYYGDELGMEDVTITQEQVQDLRAKIDEDVWYLKTRDPERSPMQWNTDSNSGFSEASSDDLYLPVHEKYTTVNVVTQTEDDDSVLNMFRRMMSLRRDYRALTSREISFISASDKVVTYVREINNDKSRFFIALNFGGIEVEDDYYNTGDGSTMPLQGTVVVASDVQREGTRVELNKLHLAPGEGLVILLDEIVYVGDSWWYKYFRPASN